MDGNIEKPVWLSKAEAADYLKVGQSTINRWVDQGRLSAMKLGKFLRFLESDLQELIEKSRVNKK